MGDFLYGCKMALQMMGDLFVGPVDWEAIGFEITFMVVMVGVAGVLSVLVLMLRVLLTRERE